MRRGGEASDGELGATRREEGEEEEEEEESGSGRSTESRCNHDRVGISKGDVALAEDVILKI